MSPRWFCDNRVVDIFNPVVTIKRVLTLPKITSTAPLKRVRFQELRNLSLPYDKSLLFSTLDSIENFAAPEEVDLEDKLIRALT